MTDLEKIISYFKQISKIPRTSGDEQAISDYLVAFAKERNLEVIQDEYNNVIIKKPAFPGKSIEDQLFSKDILTWSMSRQKTLIIVMRTESRFWIMGSSSMQKIRRLGQITELQSAMR